MSKRAVILAGGKGTRLKPYTVSLPKPLVPVGDKPILEIIISQLKKHGFDHITITVNHMADIIKAFFGDGSKWNIKIDYTTETKALSTIGPLTLINDLPDNFLVMNGDVLTDMNYSAFYDYHKENGAVFTIGSFRRTDKIDYGLLHQNENGELIKFEEKPDYNFLVSMGVYMVSKNVLQYVPEDTFFGFDHLMYKLLDEKRLPKIYEYNGYWLDIGRPSDYEIAVNKVTNSEIEI
ncbi:NTP transferase domain-containing protein [Flavobacterium salilacus subsp. salilacus]|uniref:sugar phosphate nucleotidyltransferase n=1 Tax=Flavobacterium TaxID=237 RepID=UPI001074C81E|nr:MULTISPECIES: sugar phosphate nucleotidyltransferase [Flavobacterium]KAF2519768.1 NTP transferase domain-containing protein [Flavobacterium salilacus subsp. salilacus]MBE1614337.1 NTP transferase domain-containing protein [Flavobacterium sp. SaA2.13]